MKIKEFFHAARERVGAGFRRYVPFHLGAIASGLVLMGGIHDVLEDQFVFDMTRGIAWGMLAGLFIGLVATRRGWNVTRSRITQLLVTIAVAAAGCLFWSKLGENSPRYPLWVMLYSGSMVSLVALCVRALYGERNEKTLFVKLVTNAVLVLAAAAIVFLGSLVCYLAYSALISKLDSEIIGDIGIVAFYILAPIAYVSLLPLADEEEESVGERAARIVFWILLPLALFLLGILYAYLFKIVFTMRMPSGQLNWFGSAALAVYVFFWLALRNYENRFFRFFVRRGWAFLVPVTVFQIVGIAIRYHAYGLTAWRYAGMITLALGIYALALAALRRGPRSLFLAIAIGGIVFTVTPVNIIDAPIRDQESRLRAALERNGALRDGHFVVPENAAFSESDSVAIIGAWDYLVDRCRYYRKSDIPDDCPRKYEFGTVKPKVWGEAKFTLGLCDDLKALCASGPHSDDPLVDFLGLKRRKSSSGNTRYCWISIQYPAGKDFELAPGTKKIAFGGSRGSWNVKRKDDGGWELVNGESKDAPRVYDVTEKMKAILSGAGLGETLERKSFILDDELSLWRLDDGLFIKVFNLEFRGQESTPLREGTVYEFLLMKE